MISYQKLITSLQNKKTYSFSIKNKYTIIIRSLSKYHITIFQDQWDLYEEKCSQPYHLFHISSNNEQDRCSSYFWVCKNTNKIQNIPDKFFSYEQPTYNFTSSTRSRCPSDSITNEIKIFQQILDNIRTTITK